jgi:hypothetical protein
MATRVKNAVEPTKTKPGVDRGGSRPKPPKVGAQRARLEATRAMPDHEKAKRRLTDKTVAFSPALHRRALLLVLSMDYTATVSSCTSWLNMVCQMPAFGQRLNRL